MAIWARIIFQEKRTKTMDVQMYQPQCVAEANPSTLTLIFQEDPDNIHWGQHRGFRDEE
jgi:hypothetical protein